MFRSITAITSSGGGGSSTYAINTAVDHPNGTAVDGASVWVKNTTSGNVINDTTTGASGITNNTGLTNGTTYDVIATDGDYFNTTKTHTINDADKTLSFTLERGYINASVDAANGSALSSATVDITNTTTSTSVGSYSADGSGYVNASSINDGSSYDVTANAPNHFATTSSTTLPGSDQSLQFTLYRGYINATVKNQSGDLIDGATVTITNTSTSTDVVSTDTTTGTINQSSINNGTTYDVSATEENYDTDTKSATLKDSDESVTLTLAYLQYHADGRVVDDTGRELDDATVYIKASNGTVIDSAPADSKGIWNGSQVDTQTVDMVAVDGCCPNVTKSVNLNSNATVDFTLDTAGTGSGGASVSKEDDGGGGGGGAILVSGNGAQPTFIDGLVSGLSNLSESIPVPEEVQMVGGGLGIWGGLRWLRRRLGFGSVR